MIRTLLSLSLASLLLACPKSAPTSTLQGSDDEKMDMLAAQLEELRTRGTDLSCDETCSLKTKVCGLSATACDVAGRHADRADYQQRCVTAQEECAKFNEGCSACKK